MNQPPPITLDPPAQAPGIGVAEPNGHEGSRHPALPPRQNGHPAPAPPTGSGPFEPCQECGAPMDRQQRYCVNCAARRGDVDNPSSQYFAAASRWRRRGGQRRTPTSGSGSRAAAVGFFALLPIAVAIGVLVGRGGSDSGSSDAALLDALKNQNATASTAAGAATSTVASNDAGSSKILPSDFSLDSGYTVKIDLLPVSSTDSASAASAKSAAEKKGAKDVGIINPSDFQLTPSQGTSNYILYAGEFKTKGEATKALGGLKKSFSKSEVIAVKKPTTDSVGQVVAKTKYGTVHSVTNYKPSQKEIQKGTNIVNDIANETGQSYIKQQQHLPDIIPVGGNPNSAPPLPTGGGD
jgi:hypothetical protein